MSTAWNWPGSRWWRVDLHTHTPESYDFSPDADRLARDWKRWLESARDNGVEAIGITDHNASGAIDELRAIATTVENAPSLLPGVELTANDGTHILILLDAACGKSHVDEILTLAGITVDQRGKQTARSTLNVEQILSLKIERGLVCIGAHVNGPHGLLEHDGGQRLGELRHTGLLGVEVDPTRPIDTTWIDGTRPEVGRAIAQTWGSDGHTFSDLGRRFTWVKMTSPSLEGLRLALLDGPDSFKPAKATDTYDPNVHAAYAIEAITVSKAKYLGRPNPFTVQLNPWLNAVIGGRGTGKSTLVDFFRLALRREAELKGDDETSLRAVFDRRMRVPPGRDEEGLLTGDTEIYVTYRKDGEQFILTWDAHNHYAPITRLDPSGSVAEEGDVRERFPIRIYSQKQLFDLAKKPNALLTVIDDSQRVKGGELARQMAESESRFISLAAEARALRAQASDLPARKASLTDVRRKIGLLQQGDNAKTFTEYRLRRDQDQKWSQSRTIIGNAIDNLKDLADGLPTEPMEINPELGAYTGTANLTVADNQLRSGVKVLQDKVNDAIEAMRLLLAEVQQGPDAQVWETAVKAAEESYQKVIAELVAGGIANPDVYRDLLDQAATLTQTIAELDVREEQAKTIEKDAIESLTKYRTLRKELTTRRAAFAQETSSDVINVGIHGSVLCVDFEAYLRDALSVTSFAADINALVEATLPGKGLVWDHGKLDALVQKLREFLSNPQMQWDAQDKRFETALRRVAPERIDRLALYLPADSVEVSFKDPRDPGRGWKKLAQGSPGQQTAALLAFVLGYGEEPIILDQPEDDLDNTLIYELVVRRLREKKQVRQVIVVTHNPNIVVHGDAEYVVSLEASEGQTRLAVVGGLQEQKVREEICRVMEGGREAFDKRYHRITTPSLHQP
jgi:energy-coupling factor transporter ATP-binding protein EcfA2